MGKRMVLCMVCLFILFSGFPSIVTYAADSDLYKNIDETATDSNDDYFVYYRDNYQLDTEDMAWKDIMEKGMNALSNAVFTFQVLLSKLTISLFSFSLSSNIADMLGSFIEPFVTAMHETLWNEFAVFFIAIAAFLLLVKMARNRTVQAMSGMVSLVLIVTLAFAFYTYPLQLLKGVDTVTSGVADTVMEAPYKAVTDGQAQDAKGKASALCWQLFVHQPWQILEFGSVKTAERYQDDILKLEPDSQQRKDKVEELAKSENLFSKSMSYQIGRLTTALLLLLFNLMLMIVMVIFSVLLIGYQFLILVYVILGIFIFLIALIPTFGLPLVSRWASRIISVAFTRILVVFFLSVMLVFMGVIYKFTDEYGLLTTMFLILVVLFSIWLERYRLLNLFSSIKVTGTQPQATMDKMLNQDFNAVDSVQRWKQSAGEFKEKKSSEMKSWKNSRVEKKSKYTEEKNTRKYEENAASILRNRYECSKKEADNIANERAKSEGKEIGSIAPEYGAFVKRTDANRTLGLGEFDEKDISATVQKLKMTDQGVNELQNYHEEAEVELEKRYADIQLRSQKSEDIDQLDSEFITRTDATRELNKGKFNDQDIQSVSRSLKKQNLREWKGERKALVTMKPVKRPAMPTGIDFFKKTFGEEGGEINYAAVTEKYGKEMVDNFEFAVPSGKLDKRGKPPTMSYAEVLRQMEQTKRVESKNMKPQVKPAAENLRKNEVDDESS